MRCKGLGGTLNIYNIYIYLDKKKKTLKETRSMISFLFGDLHVVVQEMDIDIKNHHTK